MSAWNHPTLGPIVAIPEKLRPKKVWTHFCAPDERWEHLCGGGTSALLTEIERATGLTRVDHDELPRLDGRRWADAQATLQRAHDQAYGPAYLGELASPHAYWTPGMDRLHRHLAATPRGVLVVVQLDTPSWVVTAYRPHPPLRGVLWEEAHYVRSARSRVDREIAMASDSWIRTVVDDLRRTGAALPSSVGQSWGLVLAVAYGRLVAAHEHVREPLAAAERILAAMQEGLRRQLAESLDWSGLLDRIASSLKAERSEELEAVLDDAEQALLVGITAGDTQAAEAFCERAAELLEWIDPGWIHLGAAGVARSRRFDVDSLPARLWAGLAEVIVAGALESSVPAEQPLAVAAEQKGSVPAIADAWMQRLVAFAGKGPQAVRAWIETNLAPAAVLVPAPMMSQQVGPALSEVHAKMVGERQSVRAFIVAWEEPQGADVTEAFRKDGLLWELEPLDEGVLLVLLAGDAPIPGESLDDALAAAEHRSDVAAAARWLTQPR